VCAQSSAWSRGRSTRARWHCQPARHGPRHKCANLVQSACQRE